MVDAERRHDRETANMIAEALRMQTAFGNDAARGFLLRNGMGNELAMRVLAVRYDQRQCPDAMPNW